MEGARGQLFSGARLPVDQDSAAGRRADGDLLAKRPHRDAVADHYVVVDLLAQPQVVSFELPLSEGVSESEDRALDLQRLLYEIERSELSGAHSRCYAAVPADHYYGCFRI